MNKTNELNDRYVEELLREDARGQQGDESFLQDLEAAIDKGAERQARTRRERPRPRRRTMAWAALLVASAAGTFAIWHYGGAGAIGRDVLITEAPPAPQGGAEGRTSEKRLVSLNRELAAQEALVEERRKVLDTIVQAVGIPYVEGSRFGQLGEDENAIYLKSEQQLYELEREKQQLEVQVKTLLKLDSEGMMKYAAGLDLPSNGVPALYNEYQQAQRAREAALASGLGNEHPLVRESERRAEALRGDLEKSVGSLRVILGTQLDLVDGRLGEMRQVVSDRRDEAVDQALESHDYIEAKREYEKAKEELQKLKLQQSQERGRQRIHGGDPQSSLEVFDQKIARQLKVLEERQRTMGAVARRVASREHYPALTDQAWQRPETDPLSTFSVDVDTASYTNIRRMLQSGQAVPPDAVRVEECINYFDYGYAGPDGEHPFATHLDLATCPWREGHLLLKVGLKGREIPRSERPASNLVFLIDVSGSMQSANKLPLLVDSMKILVEELDERDQVSMVVYAGSEGVVLEPTRITEAGRGELLSSLETLRAGGSTNGGAGIRKAYALAQDHFENGGVNRVILCTDGDFNVGTTGKDELVQLVKERAQDGVFLSVLGFGQGNINDAMLEGITNDGNGNYFYIDSLREGRKVFLEDLSGTLITIAKDVKLQLEFNPGKVQAYRLIGYANRILEKEDFNNDKVDAGEIGAGHTVTALYEIVPVGVAADGLLPVDELKYQRPGTRKRGRGVANSEEWLTVKLRYKQPDEDMSTKLVYPLEGPARAWSETAPDFQMAAGVALFGMKLRDSRYAGRGTWDLVRQLAERGTGRDPQGYRREFLTLVGKAAGGTSAD